jgi:2-haloacid dehalogenase
MSMTHEKEFQSLVWDLGGVLIDWSPDYVYQQIYPDPTERQWFYDHVCTHAWNLRQDAGMSLVKATEDKIAEWPGYEDAIRAFYGRWVEMLGGPIQESVAILEMLKSAGRHRLFALTNWSHETFPVALDRYDFLQWFEGIVVSGQEGVIKPQREIYEILFLRYGVDPGKAVFIDDNLQNVEAARLTGMHAIHYHASDDLHDALVEMGIL